jgi:hypothetical protein
MNNNTFINISILILGTANIFIWGYLIYLYLQPIG